MPGSYPFTPTGTPTGTIVHVGVVLDASASLWYTADFGQGLIRASAEKFGVKWSQYSSFVKRMASGDKLKICINEVIASLTIAESDSTRVVLPLSAFDVLTP